MVQALTVAGGMLSMVTRVPEFDLNKDQKEQLAEATANVARHYPPVMSQKQQDIAMFCFTLGAITFAQAAAYNMRVEAERRARAAAAKAADPMGSASPIDWGAMRAQAADGTAPNIN